MKVLGVIPARGNSVRVYRKNEREFMGRPLLLWTIEAAREAHTIDRVYVSTEDWALGFMAGTNGAGIIKRPDDIAHAYSTSEDVIRHALKLHPAQYVVLLQPTSPLRTAEDIDACVHMCLKTGEAVISYRPDGSKNGAVYVAASEWIMEHDFSAPHLRYLMPDNRSLDIDEDTDFGS